MRRRRLLAALASGGVVPWLAGCSAFGDESQSVPETLTPAPVPTAPTDETAVPPGTGREVRTAYRAADPAENLPEPLGFVIRSRVGESRSVRIRLFDGDTRVYDDTVGVEGGDTVYRGDVVLRRGRYRVLADLASGGATAAATFDWRAGIGYGDLEIELTDDDIEMGQRVECTPECEPLGRGGTAVSLPYAGGSNPLVNAARIEVENPTSASRTVTIRITDDGKTILEYTYEVPPGLRLTIPAVASSGTYDVTVSSGSADREYDWIVPQQPLLRVRLGDTPRVDCGEAVGSVLVRNQDSDRHEVTVTVERDDRVVYETTVDLYSGETVSLPAVVETTGRYSIRAESGAGGVATRNWWACEGSARAEVEVELTGLVTIDTVFRY
jgi:hypothetical protein